MKKLLQFTAILLSIFVFPTVFALSPAGNWTTIDDVTGEKRAVIHINVSNHTLSGTIVEIFPQPGDTGICSKCPEEFKDKPIKGLTILWGLKQSSNGVWDGGKILDPKTGKIYRAKVTLEGDKLSVRGYIGFSALGRSQVWER